MVACFNPVQFGIRGSYYCIAHFITVKIAHHFEAFEWKFFQCLFGTIKVRLIYSAIASRVHFRFARLERIRQICLVVIGKIFIGLHLRRRINFAAQIRTGIFDEIAQILKLLPAAPCQQYRNERKIDTPHLFAPGLAAFFCAAVSDSSR